MVVMILTPYYIYVNIVVICKLYGCTKGLQNRIKHIVSMQNLSNKKNKKSEICKKQKQISLFY